MARKAVAEMKETMGALMATPSSSQASVSAALDDHVLMALPKRSLLTRTLQRKRQKITKEANNGQVLPAVPCDLRFAIPEQFREMVQYDSGPGVISELKITAQNFTYKHAKSIALSKNS